MSTKTPTEEQPLERLLRRPEVERVTGLSCSTLYDLIAKSEFPSPIRLTARTVAWRASDIASWIEARCSASRLRVAA